MVLCRAMSFTAKRNLFQNNSCHAIASQLNYSSEQKDYPRKILSGVQPTGVLHLGNYFGAIKRWVDLQNSETDVSFFLADLHSMTLPHEPKVLRHNTLQMVASLMACGIDPTKSNIFAQSSVPQHAELCWIFTCLTTMARLSHLPQYKEKSAGMKDIPTGLFIYPILQAADILVHKATHIPCGEDQTQQLQLAQYMSSRFNKKFGQTFPRINSLIADDPSARIRSLRDPSKKQSKSDPDFKGRITLLDPPEIMLERIRKALTDFQSELTYEPEKRPGVANLLTIHSLITNQTVHEICEESKGIDTGKYKLVLADILIAHFGPIREKIVDYMKNPDYLSSILAKGADRAKETAEETMREVKDKVGLHSF